MTRQRRVGQRTVTQPPAWGAPEALPTPDGTTVDAPEYAVAQGTMRLADLIARRATHQAETTAQLVSDLAGPIRCYIITDEEDTVAGEHLPDSIIEALRNCDRAAVRPPVVEDHVHEHMWIDERVLASRWVRRYCTGCGADESYDDSPDEEDVAVDQFQI